jgi:hypothetical protein
MDNIYQLEETPVVQGHQGNQGQGRSSTKEEMQNNSNDMQTYLAEFSVPARQR